MSFISSLGNATKTTILKSEGHKLTEEFTVADGQTLKRMQPVKLTADGKVTAWAAADGQTALIGYCYSDAAEATLVTVFTRGFIQIYALSSGALSCGPVTWSSFDSATEVSGMTGFNKVAALGGGGANIQESIGWLLDQADGANELVRVLLKN